MTAAELKGYFPPQIHLGLSLWSYAPWHQNWTHGLWKTANDIMGKKWCQLRFVFSFSFWTLGMSWTLAPFYTHTHNTRTHTWCSFSLQSLCTCYSTFFFFFNAYFLRERESTLGRGREREREKSQAGSTPLSAQSPMQGSNSQTVRSWPKLKSRVGYWPTEQPRRPCTCYSSA